MRRSGRDARGPTEPSRAGAPFRRPRPRSGGGPALLQQRAGDDPISLEIDTGEIFGLLGDNGAGKTTVVRQMVGVLTPTSGTITLFGKDVGRDPLHVTTHVGTMPQEARPLNNATVIECLVWTARLRGLSRGLRGHGQRRRGCALLYDGHGAEPHHVPALRCGYGIGETFPALASPKGKSDRRPVRV